MTKTNGVCSRVLCVVDEGWRVRCLHWVAVVLVGFSAFPRPGTYLLLRVKMYVVHSAANSDVLVLYL
jgi:hypothetical protein